MKSSRRKLPEGLPNFIQVDGITLDTFILNLKMRYESEQIYSYIGESLIAVNPYEDRNLFGDDIVGEYKGSGLFQNAPHPFSIADAAHQIATKAREDTCIVVTGESGSGKTEISKAMMQYLAKITLPSGQADVERVRNLLINSNILLEAFGNARTMRNSNSSRFMKYTHLDFNFLAQPVGGIVTTYMLEKDRVVLQEKGDRNFHIFYRLLNSQDTVLLKQLQLNANCKLYSFLSEAGEPFSIKGVVEKEMYKVTREAMSSVGFHEKEHVDVFKIVAAVLHLGQVHFDKAESDEVSRVTNMNSVTPVANLLGLRMDELMPALVGKSTTAKGDSANLKFGKDQAYLARDALAKSLYQRLFFWLVKRINENTSPPNIKGSGKLTKLGLIDIYGFEIAETNSLEQLCINYCSEHLQQLFIAPVLVEAQQEYLREGIPWINIDIHNNEMILKMIEEPNRGMLAIIEEMTAKGDKTDYDILCQMDKVFNVHQHYASNASGDQSLHREHEFNIKHYEIEVMYSTRRFIRKNREVLSKDIKRVLANSKAHSMKEMWSDSVNEATATFVSEMKDSVQKLNEIISDVSPLYVRCIRPNSSKFPMKLVDSIVEHQVRFLNLVEHVKVRKSGFAFNQSYSKFIQRYKCICPSIEAKIKNSKDATLALMNYLSWKDEYRIGKSKLFLNNANMIIELEAKRQESLPKFGLQIQSLYRRHLAKKRVKKIRAVYYMMAWYKKNKLRNYFNDIFKAFEGVSSMPDLGHSIKWPTGCPPAVVKGVDYMKRIHSSWRAKVLQAPFSPEQIKMIKLKGAAHTAIYGAKIDWGLHHPWEGDALVKESNPKLLAKYKQSMEKHMVTFHDVDVLWSATVVKLTSNMKGEELHLVLTDKHLYRLEGSKFELKKKSPPLTFDKIGHISLFPGPDQAAVLHLDKAGDLAFYVQGERCIGEFIGNYIVACSKLRINTPIEVSAIINTNLEGKMKELVLVESSVEKPVFHKGQKNQIVLAWSLMKEVDTS